MPAKNPNPTEHTLKMREYRKKWRDAHPNYSSEHRRTQRSRAVLSTANEKARARYGKETRITIAEWQPVWDAHEGRCAYCGSDERVGLDHVVPLKLGGEHSIENCIPACWTCNQKKSAIPPEELSGAVRVAKYCSGCGETLPMESFAARRRGGPNGRQHLCRVCSTAFVAEWKRLKRLRATAAGRSVG